MNFLVVITGPTGVGKTKTAIEIAQHFSTEIISSDSRQFYKEIPIGTAAPTPYEQKQVPHHFVGHLSIQDTYNAYSFQNDVIQYIPSLFKKNNIVIMCGGSGMYIDAVCKGIDNIPDIEPEIRQKVIEQHQNEGIASLRTTLKKLDPDYYAIVDLKNPARLMRAIEVCFQTGKPYTSVRKNTQHKRDFVCIPIALSMPRNELYTNIHTRTDKMIAQGLEDEARAMLPYKNHTALKTVGYKEFFAYFEGKTSRNFAIEKIKQNSRNYAKRQISWIKRNDEYAWFLPQETASIISHITARSKEV